VIFSRVRLGECRAGVPDAPPASERPEYLITVFVGPIVQGRSATRQQGCAKSLPTSNMNGLMSGLAIAVVGSAVASLSHSCQISSALWKLSHIADIMTQNPRRDPMPCYK
jgi:hypothetical protein